MRMNPCRRDKHAFTATANDGSSLRLVLNHNYPDFMSLHTPVEVCKTCGMIRVILTPAAASPLAPPTATHE